VSIGAPKPPNNAQSSALVALHDTIGRYEIFAAICKLIRRWQSARQRGIGRHDQNIRGVQGFHGEAVELIVSDAPVDFTIGSLDIRRAKPTSGR
jgi:hypothetical protein